jgi:hypothetical protein
VIEDNTQSIHHFFADGVFNKQQVAGLSIKSLSHNLKKDVEPQISQWQKIFSFIVNQIQFGFVYFNAHTCMCDER